MSEGRRSRWLLRESGLCRCGLGWLDIKKEYHEETKRQKELELGSRLVSDLRELLILCYRDKKVHFMGRVILE